MGIFGRYTILNDFRKYALIITFLLAIFPSVTYSQRAKEEAPPLRERIFFGGSFGLQFGTLTDIEFSPVVGIWLLPRVNVAAGPKYRFYKDPFDRTDIYGGRVYTQFVLIQDFNNLVPIGVNLGFFLHAENELLSLENEFWQYSLEPKSRFNINTPFVGVGISQGMGRRSSMNIMALWALTDPGIEIYSNPEFRISFIF